MLQGRIVARTWAGIGQSLTRADFQQEPPARACSSSNTSQYDIRLAFIRPGKPVENEYIESFNGKFRDEFLNEHWFVTMDHARRAIDTWCEE